MRLTIFGASGRTGRQLLNQALAAGHTATAVARDPTRLPVHHHRLKVVAADALDPAAIQPAVAGADAVVSALGPHPAQPVVDHVGRDGQHP
jgi:putative NADH-flavin reductase